MKSVSINHSTVGVYYILCAREILLFWSYQFQHKYVISIEPIHWCVISVFVCASFDRRKEQSREKKAYGKRVPNVRKARKKNLFLKMNCSYFAGHNIGSACVPIIDKINPWQPSKQRTIPFNLENVIWQLHTHHHHLVYLLCSVCRIVHLSFDARPALRWYHIIIKSNKNENWKSPDTDAWCTTSRISKWWTWIWHSAFGVRHSATVFIRWMAERSVCSVYYTRFHKLLHFSRMSMQNNEKSTNVLRWVACERAHRWYSFIVVCLSYSFVSAPSSSMRIIFHFVVFIFVDLIVTLFKNEIFHLVFGLL